MGNKCKDCKNISLRDVFSGVCLLSQEKILIDNAACSKFDSMDKCKFCKKYQPYQMQKNLGSCNGVMVYPDLSGCDDFVKA